MHSDSVLSVSEPPPRRLDPGRRIGLYEVESSIASGGMGAVYRAREVESGRPVALKRMLEGGDATQFEIEARLLAHLDHPRVVGVIDHFEDDHGTYTLVMDLIEGSDLARLLWDEGSPGLSVSYVLERAQEACEALDYLHAQSIVHGDIKPRNLVMSRAGAVVVDFGLAARMGHGSGNFVSSAGTARFMAPEVFMGDPISPRSDLYSLAASVWNLLSGSPPAYGEAEQLAGLMHGLGPSVEEALRSALALDPGHRIASARELADALGVRLDARRGCPWPTASTPRGFRASCSSGLSGRGGRVRGECGVAGGGPGKRRPPLLRRVGRRSEGVIGCASARVRASPAPWPRAASRSPCPIAATTPVSRRRWLPTRATCRTRCSCSRSTVTDGRSGCSRSSAGGTAVRTRAPTFPVPAVRGARAGDPGLGPQPPLRLARPRP